jgi:hypothetical protein
MLQVCATITWEGNVIKKKELQGENTMGETLFTTFHPKK